MSVYSGMIIFEFMGGLEVGRMFMNSVCFCVLVESFGVVEIMIIYFVIMIYVDVFVDERWVCGFIDSVVCFSVGIEDF